MVMAKSLECAALMAEKAFNKEPSLDPVIVPGIQTILLNSGSAVLLTPPCS